MEPIAAAPRLFFALGAVFVACLVVSDIIGLTKIVDLGSIGDQPLRITVGMLAFPLTFVITDLVNEFYGPRTTRFMTWVGLAMLVVTFVILLVADALPTAPNTPFSAELFSSVFGSSLRLIVASLTAYLVGQLLDILVFGALKRLARGRHVWLRATGSTVVSQLLDTVVVQFVGFSGQQPVEEIWILVGSSYLIKFAVAVGMTPIVYLGHAVLERVFHLRPVPVETEGKVRRPAAA